MTQSSWRRAYDAGRHAYQDNASEWKNLLSTGIAIAGAVFLRWLGFSVLASIGIVILGTLLIAILYFGLIRRRGQR